MKTTNAEICLTPGPSHVRSTLEAAASQDFTHNFSDVTLVFSDGSMVYYSALLYLISPWWKELLIQVQILPSFFCFFPFNLPSQYCSSCSCSLAHFLLHLFCLSLPLLQMLYCTLSSCRCPPAQWCSFPIHPGTSSFRSYCWICPSCSLKTPKKKSSKKVSQSHHLINFLSKQISLDLNTFLLHPLFHMNNMLHYCLLGQDKGIFSKNRPLGQFFHRVVMSVYISICPLFM